MYQVTTFVNQKTSWGIVKFFWKFEVQRSPRDYIQAKLKNQKSWSQHDQIWYKIPSWKSWLKLHTTNEVGVVGKEWPRHIESTCRCRCPMEASVSSSIFFLYLLLLFRTNNGICCSYETLNLQNLMYLWIFTFHTSFWFRFSLFLWKYYMALTKKITDVTICH